MGRSVFGWKLSLITTITTHNIKEERILLFIIRIMHMCPFIKLTPFNDGFDSSQYFILKFQIFHLFIF